MDYKKIIKSIFLVLFGTLIFGAIVFATTVGTNVDVTGNMSIGGTAGFTGATTFNAAISPLTNDSAALGSASLKWSDLFLASGGVINFDNGDITLTHASNALTIAGGNYTLTQAIATSGSPTGLTFTGGAHTTLAASTETTDVFFDLTRTVQFAAGTPLTTQRAMRIGQPTYGFVEASTINTATTVEIAGPPRAGANATITTSSALKIGRGDSTNPVDTPNGATMAVIDMPDIANGVGAMTNLIGFQLSGSTAQLGNQNATLDFFAGVHLLGVTLTSGATSTRTVGFAVTLDVAGPPVASTNVVFSGPARAVDIGGDVITKGTAQELRVSTGAHTGMTLSTEATGIDFDLSATKEWAAGDIATQREFRIQAPTYGFVGASTITGAASTIWINRPPRAGTNATITTAASFQMGASGADANATTASHLLMYPLAIRNGYGTMTTLAGINYSDNGAGVSLGSQTATLTNLNAIRLGAITYTSATNTTRTVTNPATLYIGGAPVASTNVTFTNPALALHVASGTSRFDGRVLQTKGADVTSANNMTLGADGNFFDITDTTQINCIEDSGWTSGSVVYLQFDGSVTVANNQTCTDTDEDIQLSASGNFSATAGDTLTLIFEGTAWRELARTAI